MTALFTELIKSMKRDGDAFQISITEDWMQGRTTYGGLSAALCFDVAVRTFPDLPPLRSAMVNFIGPAGGDVRGEARLLRKGKSVAFVEADIIGEKGLATRAVFTFGAERPSAFDVTFTPRPSVPAPEACEPYHKAGGLSPSFTQRFETRLAKGGRPFSGSDQHDHYLWVRHVDDKASDLTALLALADMPPPAVLPMFKTLAPISTMTWMVNVMTPAPKTKDGWWLLRSCAEHAVEGYTSQDMFVWNHDGALAIAGRQSVAIFA